MTSVCMGNNAVRLIGLDADILEGRFSKMFSDPSFAIDTESEAFKATHSMGSKHLKVFMIFLTN